MPDAKNTLFDVIKWSIIRIVRNNIEVKCLPFILANDGNITEYKFATYKSGILILVITETNNKP